MSSQRSSNGPTSSGGTDRVALDDGDLLLAASPVEYERVDQLARKTRVQMCCREDVAVVRVRAAGRCDTRGGRDRFALERAMCSDRKLIRFSRGHIRSRFAELGVRTEARTSVKRKRGPVPRSIHCLNLSAPVVCYGPLHGQSRGIKGLHDEEICKQNRKDRGGSCMHLYGFIYR